MSADGWIACAEELPPVPVAPWDMSDSGWVLVKCADESRHVALLRKLFDGDGKPSEDCQPRWVQRGRDGWDLENVTHWRILP